MAKEWIAHADTSRIERVFLPDSSSITGAGLTGLSSSSSGLIIATIADIEEPGNTDVVYKQSASTIEAVTTLGLYAAPTATKCRFKELDSTNYPGEYEIQLANTRYAVNNAQKLKISIHGATNLAPTIMELQLGKLDPQADQVTQQDINAEVDTALDTAIPGTPTAGSVNEHVKSIVDLYHADIDLSKDNSNSQDEYTVTWFKNGIRVTSGITSPTIQVVKRVDGTDLVASTAMTQIGSIGSYKYDESSNRKTDGEADVVIIGATIDGSARSFTKVISRDTL